MGNPTKKLKLLCTINGGFRRRFTGEETRLILVDPTNLTFLKLCSLISQLFQLSNSDFKLRYKLPSSETHDSPLITLDSDDDVMCMVEEYMKFVALYGENKDNFSRLWVFVVDPLEGLCESLDFDYGFRVLGDNNSGFRVLGDNNSGFMNLMKDSYDTNHGKNYNHRRKKVVNDHACLRKLVLKKQLMLLAKQREQCGNFDCKFGANLERYDDQPRIGAPDSCITKNYVIDANSVTKFHCNGDLPNDSEDFGGSDSTLWNLLPMSPRDSNLFGERIRGLGCRTGSCCKGMSGCENDEHYLNRENFLPSSIEGNDVSDGEDFDGSDSTLSWNSLPLNPRDGNLFEEKNRGLGCRIGSCCKGMSGCVNDKHYLNRENFLPSSLECSVMCGELNGRDSVMSCCDRGDGVSSHCGIRSHQSCLSQNRSVGVGKMGGKVLVGAKFYPGLGVSKQGQGLRFHDSNSSRPLTGLDRSKVVEMRKLIDHDKAIVSKQGSEESVKKSEVCQCLGIGSPQTSEDISIVKPFGMTYEAKDDKCSEATIKFEPYHDDVDVNELIDSHPKQAGIASSIDFSSNTPAMSITGIMAKLEKSCSLQEEMQDDPPVSPKIEDKVESRKNQKHTNILDKIPSDLADIYTLAAQGLQKIKEYDLEYIKELGSGNYGIVYHGKWKGSDVAIKKMKPSCFNGDAKEEKRLVTDFWKEALMLSQLHHPNIVAFYGVVTDGPIQNLAIVTEYMVNGSLKQVLRRKDRTIDRRKRLIIAMDAAFGMEYLHEKRIVHFDLKSHNFLVNMKDPQRPVCKIGDLGLSKIKRKTMVSGGVRGTIPWMAPELLNTSTKLVTEKVDVYSFGIVMWELLTGEEPYAGMRSGDVIAGKIKGTLQPDIPSWCDPAWRSLMERCWSYDPTSRPSFSVIAKELRAISAEMNIK